MHGCYFTLRTERLVLDLLTLDDLPVVTQEWGVPEVARMTATLKSGWTEAEAKAWLSLRMAHSPEGTGCAIRRRVDNRLIGSIGMGGTPRNLGYLISPQFWGQGYASEAAQAFLSANYAHFDELDEVEAGVFDDNPASARVLAKLGFVRAGDGDCTSLDRVEPAANSLYRLTRAAFEAAK